MVRPTPDLPDDADASGRDLGAEELRHLADAIASGTLTTTKGSFGSRLEAAVAERLGTGHAVVCSSGTAAVHAAVASLGLESGDEIITSAVTDMGAIMPVLYEGAAPVFCDVDPATCLVTADTIGERITSRTRGVIVTHLFGLMCDMRPILDLAARHGIVVIEDAAQAFLARDAAGLAGATGDVGCFSFQQGKHMTTGEGGVVVTASPERAAVLRKCVNKGWGYGEPAPDHDFPALNLRMSELQAAVGLAQLEKLAGVVARRCAVAEQLRARVGDLVGVTPTPVRAGARHSYWRFCLRVDPRVVAGGAAAMGHHLLARGVPAQPNYIGRPAYRTAVFRNWTRFPVTRLPYEAAGRHPEPVRDTMAGTEAALRDMLVLPLNESYTEAHVELVAESLRGAWVELTGRAVEAHGR